MSRRLLGRLLRAPAAHFVLLGGALFLAVGTKPAAAPPHPPDAIVLGTADVERLRREFTDQYGVPPGPVEERRLVETALDEEVLHRQALALGLDRDDPLVRERREPPDSTAPTWSSAGTSSRPSACLRRARARRACRARRRWRHTSTSIATSSPNRPASA